METWDYGRVRCLGYITRRVYIWMKLCKCHVSIYFATTKEKDLLLLCELVVIHQKRKKSEVVGKVVQLFLQIFVDLKSPL